MALEGRLRLVACLLWVGVLCSADAHPLLTNVAAIRNLSPQAAGSNLPVRLQGVVLFNYQPEWQRFILYDGTKGIFVQHFEARQSGPPQSDDAARQPLRRGMVVEVDGVAKPGDFAPVVRPTKVQVTGTADLPAPIPVNLPQLMTGNFDCLRVSIEGVIQRVGTIPDEIKNQDNVQILVATEGGGHFTALAMDPDGFIAAELVGAWVRMTGCALGFWNRRGEQLGARLQLVNRGDVEVLNPPPADPFAYPLSDLHSLKTFFAARPSQHRQRISGVITLSRRGEFFYLQSGDRAARVTTSQVEPLAVGDWVEAVGFVEIPRFYGELREAIFRKTGRQDPPLPLPIDCNLAMNERDDSAKSNAAAVDLDGRLVSIKCRLERVESTPGQPVQFYLDNQGHIFTATFGDDAPRTFARTLQPGSVLNLTGICVMTLASEWPALRYARPVGFNLLLRSPADVRVVQTPPWWTAGRLGLALSITGVILGACLMWTFALRRTVSKQAHRIMAEQQSKQAAEVEKARLRERTRLAADLHDTVEQSITAAVYLLEVDRGRPVDPADAATKRANRLYHLLNLSREELRRSLWALRTGILEGRTFLEALMALARSTESNDNIACTCAVETNGTLVPEFEASNLLLVVKEAVHNAVRHARPKKIEIAGKITAQQIRLTVTDDGKGFDIANSPGPREGHFGLQGVKERLTWLNGTLSIQSKPGGPTRIGLTMPLNPPPPAR
jgi:signal transduction histidine kinase